MKCESCGASVSPRDVELGSCGFCGTALRTAVDEAAKQAAMRELLADRDGDGVPDVLQAMHEKLEAKEAHEATAQRLETAREQLEASRRARFRWTSLAWLTPIATLVFGSLWLLVVNGILSVDPWLGAHARIHCPGTCEGCTGPYVYHSWTTTRFSGGSRSSSSTTLVYCRHPSARIETLDWSARHDRIAKHRPYQLTGGMWHLWGASLLFWLLPAAGLSALLLRWRVTRARAAIPLLEGRVAALEAELARPDDAGPGSGGTALSR